MVGVGLDGSGAGRMEGCVQHCHISGSRTVHHNPNISLMGIFREQFTETTIYNAEPSIPHLLVILQQILALEQVGRHLCALRQVGPKVRERFVAKGLHRLSLLSADMHRLPVPVRRAGCGHVYAKILKQARRNQAGYMLVKLCGRKRIKLDTCWFIMRPVPVLEILAALHVQQALQASYVVLNDSEVLVLNSAAYLQEARARIMSTCFSTISVYRSNGISKCILSVTTTIRK
jgi:hypothetical protein